MRRAPGSGSIVERDGIWIVSIWAGKKVSWRRRSAEAAEQALDEMIALHADNLGYYYRAQQGGPRHPELRFKRPRSGVSKHVRWLVFERDGFRCVYCGATAEDARLVIDHVQPIADGGSDDIDNLATACRDCNAGKGGRPLLELPPRLSVPANKP